MKNNVIIVNTARGAVTDESAITEAILKGKIGAFGCDVYSIEPFSADHPFNKILHLDNVCLTPHMAWGSYESRSRCVKIMAENIERYINNNPQNQIV